MSSIQPEFINKTKKVIIIFFFILIFLVILIASLFKTVSDNRNLPSLETKKKELAVRGDIISKDNFKIASTKKLYKVSVDTRFLDESKKELFLNLLSIYSNVDYNYLKEKISSRKPGYLVLSYNIDSRTAKNLKELAFKLRKLDVFKSKKINGRTILRGLNISESGEKRVFSYEKTLTPAVGYITKFESKDTNTTKVKGIKGLEKYYNDLLSQTKDGLLQGNRDVLSYISFDKNSVIEKRVDGANLKLNIPLKLQKNIEITLDKYKEKLGAKEIIASVMDSKTGKILALASSNRFNPEKIRQEDIPSLNVSAVESPFEPGSVIKPISIALVMDKGLINKNELLFAHNKGKKNKDGEYPKGRYKLDRYYIKDDHQFEKNYLTLDDVVIFSSNIGTLQYAQRLSGGEFYEGMKRFGFTKKTGIDLPYENKGVMPKLYQFSANDAKGEDNVFKATVSYGQGMTSTFMQVMKSYTVFNNDGYITVPKIVDYVLHNNKKYNIKDDEIKDQIISKSTADEIKRLLVKTVNEGTGTAAKINGLEVGGKTGTAQIARGGKYLRRYISSFFGFVNDEENSYTIGVTVFEPISKGKYWYYYYASHSAVPVFKEVTQNLVKLNYLTPKIDIIEENN